MDNTELILEACKKDLGKSEFESFLSDIDWAKNDAIFASKNLQKWAKDEPVTDLAFSNKILSPTIRKEPLGAVLVLGCWNYPINLSLCPLIGAIAAGCTAILKPSELAPACAMALKKVIEDSLDPEAYLVVNGGVEASTALLEHKWDKIFYTGNTQVGTIVAKKAAETLTPVTLELGGLNPAVVTRNADTRLAARRLLWSKASNAGQICLCPNYTLVHADILESLLAEFKIALKEFYPNGTKDSPDYGRIINERHFHRIKKMLDATNGKIVVGGNAVESEKFIEPTIVVVDSANDSLMKDEVFGPLITILPYTKLDEAIELINSVDSTPLALYPFGSKVETDRILDEVYSGGATVNDGLFHGGIHNLSFGGVGRSGQGAYRGKASFDTFTHLRTVVTTPNWAEALLGIRYPPYAGKVSTSPHFRFPFSSPALHLLYTLY